MGNWNITIQGCGAHHNEKHAADANRLAKEFVQALEKVGHKIFTASITFGSSDDLITVDYPAQEGGAGLLLRNDLLPKSTPPTDPA